MLRYDHYKLLGIARDASQAQIKRAYRQRVKNCHPDVNPSPRAAKVFRAVHEAYSVLSDAHRRVRYDDQLRYYRHVQSAPEQSQPFDTRKYGGRRKYAGWPEPVSTETPVGTVDRFAFIGLHLTGLLFSLALVSWILVGVTFLDWPWLTLLFTAFGIAALPDSWDGLRAGVASGTGH